jgi:hypothetical protein
MPFDVFMIRFDEPMVEAHWSRLLAVAPHATLIEGVSGIRAAHAACAERASGAHFFVVDADNWLLDGFSFEVYFKPHPDEVAVWRASNPVNGLVYGHGGIKLIPSEAAKESIESRSVDLATSLTDLYRVVGVLASQHRFNSTPLLAWRTAFRECAKLASSMTRGTIEPATVHRLNIWCSIANRVPNAQWCLLGALAGREFGTMHATDQEMLGAINDYSWLRERFIKASETVDPKVAAGS